MSSLAVVIPVHNQRAEIVQTLCAIDAAVIRANFDAEIVVVDDGSSDGTGQVASAWEGVTRVRVIEQANAGRFAARRRGVDQSAGDYCLLIDSRVLIDEGSLAFIERNLPDRRIWNAHVDIEIEGNPFGTFWDVITRRAFWEYFREPRTASFGPAEFDRFPKGTTCFFAPRALLVQAFASFRTDFRDTRNANDDTPVLRWLAARERINISPSFSCRYTPRQRLAPFLRHAFHRGTVFVDGHGRRESRFFPVVFAFFPATIAWIALSVWVPVVAPAPLILASAGGVGLALSERNLAAAPAMAWVTPIWAMAYGLGMWRGLGLALQARLGRGPR